MPAPDRPQRLRRLDQLYVRTPFIFLTFCTHERKRLLANPDVHDAFTGFCANAPDHSVHVGRYVIMPDHVHLFTVLGDSAPALATWIKSLKNSLSKTLRALKHPTPHWQKGFFDHVMRSADSYAQKWDYVRANPVRAGLALERPVVGLGDEIHDVRF